jgi:hypothetical protein
VLLFTETNNNVKKIVIGMIVHNKGDFSEV